MKGRMIRARELLLGAEPEDAELLAREFHTLRREAAAMGLPEVGRLALEAEEAAGAGDEAAPLARVACGRFLWRLETLIEQIELGAR